MIAVVAAFNQEKALVGAFSLIVKTDCGTDGSFNSVLNVIAVVAAYKQEKALVGVFSVIVQLHRLIVYRTI